MGYSSFKVIRDPLLHLLPCQCVLSRSQSIDDFHYQWPHILLCDITFSRSKRERVPKRQPQTPNVDVADTSLKARLGHMRLNLTVWCVTQLFGIGDPVSTVGLTHITPK
uniref:Uncharacterized protein n=1 Tax=Photinus pyralis TaxID=7054 RepID=A0A1Y1MC63_PHOPY